MKDDSFVTALEAIPWEGPAILLVDLDAFFASVEQLDHPASHAAGEHLRPDCE